MGNRTIKTKYRSFDEGLNETRKNALKRANEKNEALNKQKILDNETKILEVIMVNTPLGGLSVIGLSDIMRLDRRSIGSYIKKLLKKKVIGFGKNNDRYIATNKFFKEWEHEKIKTQLFGLAFLDTLNHGNMILNNKNKFVTNNYQESIPISDFTEGKIFDPYFSDNDHLEELLFEFSNRIGSFILYLIISSMNPSYFHGNKQIPPSVIELMISKAIESGTKIIVDHSSRSSIYYRFIELIAKNYGIQVFDGKKVLGPKIKNRNGIEEVRKRYLLFNKEFYKEIMTAFLKLYPSMTYEFEKLLDRRLFFTDVLKNRKPEVTARLQDQLLHKELRKKQKVCNHDFDDIVGSRNGKLLTKSQILSFSRQEQNEIKKSPFKIKYKRCRKCGLEKSNSKLNDSRKTIKKPKKIKDI